MQLVSGYAALFFIDEHKLPKRPQHKIFFEAKSKLCVWHEKWDPTVARFHNCLFSRINSLQTTELFLDAVASYFREDIQRCVIVGRI